MNMEVAFQESFLLIVLLKELLRESTFLGCKVQQFAVIELTTEVVCKQFGDYSAAAAYLPAYVNDYFPIVFHWLFV